jgi:hypothetical protein
VEEKWIQAFLNNQKRLDIAQSPRLARFFLANYSLIMHMLPPEVKVPHLFVTTSQSENFSSFVFFPFSGLGTTQSDTDHLVGSLAQLNTLFDVEGSPWEVQLRR